MSAGRWIVVALIAALPTACAPPRLPPPRATAPPEPVSCVSLGRRLPDPARSFASVYRDTLRPWLRGDELARLEAIPRREEVTSGLAPQLARAACDWAARRLAPLALEAVGLVSSARKLRELAPLTESASVARAATAVSGAREDALGNYIFLAAQRASASLPVVGPRSGYFAVAGATLTSLEVMLDQVERGEWGLVAQGAAISACFAAQAGGGRAAPVAASLDLLRRLTIIESSRPAP